MKVIIISAEFPPAIGGVGTFAYNLARGLQAVGASVRVLTSAGGGSQECVHDVAVRRTPPRRLSKALKIVALLRAALQLCAQERPDAILAMSWSQAGVVAYLVRHILGIEYALCTYGTDLLWMREKRVERAVARRIIDAAGVLVAISTFTKDLVVSLGVDPGRVVIVNPPLDLAEWPDGVETGDVEQRFDLRGKRVLLTAARLVKRKGHAQVIQVLSELRERYPDLVYVMTGEGTYRQVLVEAVRRWSVEDRVRMVGSVPRADLRQLYYRTDVYISPSQEDHGDIEGFGIALIEAGACRKPVIAGRIGGVADAVIDGETGFLVDPLDTEALKRTLIVLLDDPALRARMGQAGRRRVEHEFGLSTQAAKLVDALG